MVKCSEYVRSLFHDIRPANLRLLAVPRDLGVLTLRGTAQKVEQGVNSMARLCVKITRNLMILWN